MDDPELEELRRRKLAEMQANQQQAAMQQQAAEDQRRQIDMQKQAILRQILTPDARDRLSNIRVANRELADSVEMQLIQLAQSGRLQNVVTDAMLRDILRQVAPQHREITIERR
jgi:programmed cell death protein 5